MRRKNMTVRELIEELQKYDGDSRVWIWKERSAVETERVTSVTKRPITKDNDIVIS